ncbi:unnamed protein product, partial [Dovyalis caffra]
MGRGCSEENFSEYRKGTELNKIGKELSMLYFFWLFPFFNVFWRERKDAAESNG